MLVRPLPRLKEEVEEVEGEELRLSFRKETFSKDFETGKDGIESQEKVDNEEEVGEVCFEEVIEAAEGVVVALAEAEEGNEETTAAKEVMSLGGMAVLMGLGKGNLLLWWLLLLLLLFPC
jgi:hypothetical protein